MNSLLDRLAALDAARLVAVSGALVVLLLDTASVYSAVIGKSTSAQLAVVLAAALIAALGLLYPFRLGTPPASV